MAMPAVTGRRWYYLQLAGCSLKSATFVSSLLFCATSSFQGDYSHLSSVADSYGYRADVRVLTETQWNSDAAKLASADLHVAWQVFFELLTIREVALNIGGVYCLSAGRSVTR